MSLKNGLDNRDQESRTSKILGGVAATYLILCFLAPLALPADSVPELSGRANAIDYMYGDSWGNKNHSENSNIGHNQNLHGGEFAWMELNPLWAFVYGFGDINCHQKHERSWEINGNQMPVCTRDVGIFFGFSIGCLFFFFRGFNRWTIRDTFLSVFPDEWIEGIYERDLRLFSVCAILAIGLAPMGVDGFSQLLLSYESNNPLRIVTGFGSGFVIGWWFCSAFSAKPNFFTGPQDVELPRGSRLVER